MKLALVIATIGVIAGAFFYGVHVGKQSNENKVLKAEVSANQSRQRINHEVKNLKHDDIVRELADGGWLRDD